ncbi:MAG: type II secretion system protein GspE, partial [Acidobacteriota bacterium]
MRLGEILIERRLITEEDLARALELQRERPGEKIGKIFVDLGFVAARDVLAALSHQLRVPVLAIDGPPASSPEIETLSPRFLRQFRCIPVALHDHTVTLAMADPLDFETRSTVSASTGL